MERFKAEKKKKGFFFLFLCLVPLRDLRKAQKRELPRSCTEMKLNETNNSSAHWCLTLIMRFANLRTKNIFNQIPFCGEEAQEFWNDLMAFILQHGSFLH